jgi:hypothetical protein
MDLEWTLGVRNNIPVSSKSITGLGSDNIIIGDGYMTLQHKQNGNKKHKGKEFLASSHSLFAFLNH